MPPPPQNLETDSRFPSGEWSGSYIQPKISRDRRRMNLCQSFQAGVFTGEGKDGVGEFLIRGRYELRSVPRSRYSPTPAPPQQQRQTQTQQRQRRRLRHDHGNRIDPEIRSLGRGKIQDHRIHRAEGETVQ